MIFDYFYVSAYCVFFFFFFQAEDGIRDRTVTGVQTCALPIFDLATGAVRMLPLFRSCKNLDPKFAPDSASLYFISNAEGVPDIYRYYFSDSRSEERRVGKECRSRCSP